MIRQTTEVASNTKKGVLISNVVSIEEADIEETEVVVTEVVVTTKTTMMVKTSIVS